MYYFHKIQFFLLVLKRCLSITIKDFSRIFDLDSNYSTGIVFKKDIGSWNNNAVENMEIFLSDKQTKIKL